jgi:Peptidogalycan biosysnthesis/recognition
MTFGAQPHTPRICILPADEKTKGPLAEEGGRVDVLSRLELTHCRHWQSAFVGQRKDHRFYELVEDTIRQGFNYRYFAIKDGDGETRAIQPFFTLEQDLLGGLSSRTRAMADAARRVWPRLLKMRTLMVGCAVGEAHLDGSENSHASNAKLLASAVVEHAHAQKASLIVLKEFPAVYRQPLNCLLHHGFTRVPSLPMTRLNINYPSFEDYMAKALNSATRRKLKKKFAAAAAASPIQTSVLSDVTPVIDEIYPLYLQVYNRSKMHFEQLTRQFFCGIGRLMPDKVRFFIWRQNGRIVAFTLCMVEGDAMYTEYICQSARKRDPLSASKKDPVRYDL